MGKAQEFLTPIGRLVQGDCFEPQTKDQNGAPLVTKTGANAGQPTQKYFVAVAFKKGLPEVEAMRAKWDALARVEFPQFFPTPGGPCVNPNFSNKIIDGDSIDSTGKQNASKDGFAGHWVFRFSSTYPPKCFARPNFQPHEQLSVVGGVNPIPRGHFVSVAGTMSGNGNAMKPGLYVNCNMIAWEHIGDVIVSGPDAATVFGGGAAQPAAGGKVMLPAAGATTYAAYISAGWTDATLIANGYMAAPAAVVAAPAPAPAPAAPPVAAPPPQPVAVAPHTGILAGPQMLPPAGATPYAAYIAAGWTDATLIANGYMAAPAAPAAAAPAPLALAGSAPPPPNPAPAAPAHGGKVMLPPAGATTYAAYIAAGWTDATLIQNGFMAA